MESWASGLCPEFAKLLNAKVFQGFESLTLLIDNAYII